MSLNLQDVDIDTAMPKAAHCIHGLSQLLDLLNQQQSEDASCLLWVTSFSSLLTTQQTVRQQFVAEVLPYLLVYCVCGLGPAGAQVTMAVMVHPARRHLILLITLHEKHGHDLQFQVLAMMFAKTSNC